jgi:hypothetical protein
MSAKPVQAEPVVDLDRDQELILIRRFADAVAAAAETHDGPDAAPGSTHHERERAWRLALNMRGHLR